MHHVVKAKNRKQNVLWAWRLTIVPEFMHSTIFKDWPKWQQFYIFKPNMTFVQISGMKSVDSKCIPSINARPFFAFHIWQFQVCSGVERKWWLNDSNLAAGVDEHVLSISAHSGAGGNKSRHVLVDFAAVCGKCCQRRVCQTLETIFSLQRIYSWIAERVKHAIYTPHLYAVSHFGWESKW